MNLGSKRGLVRKLLTAGLIAALPVMLAPVAAQPLAGVTGITGITGIRGTVFAGETGTPLTGARLHLTQVGTEEAFTSGATDAKGVFELGDLPAASYEVAVEFEGGLYVVEMPVVIASREAVTLNLAIPHIASVANRGASETVAGAGGFLAGPVAATMIVAGSAIAVGALVESSTDDGIEASVFLP